MTRTHRRSLTRLLIGVALAAIAMTPRTVNVSEAGAERQARADVGAVGVAPAASRAHVVPTTDVR
jgi:hypothetical protein